MQGYSRDLKKFTTNIPIVCWMQEQWDIRVKSFQGSLWAVWSQLKHKTTWRSVLILARHLHIDHLPEAGHQGEDPNVHIIYIPWNLQSENSLRHECTNCSWEQNQVTHPNIRPVFVTRIRSYEKQGLSCVGLQTSRSPHQTSLSFLSSNGTVSASENVTKLDRCASASKWKRDKPDFSSRYACSQFWKQKGRSGKVEGTNLFELRSSRAGRSQGPLILFLLMVSPPCFFCSASAGNSSPSETLSFLIEFADIVSSFV